MTVSYISQTRSKNPLHLCLIISLYLVPIIKQNGGYTMDTDQILLVIVGFLVLQPQLSEQQVTELGFKAIA